MQTLFRLIAVLLVLTTGGVFQTLAFASDLEDACEGGDGHTDCSDCTSPCGLCLRCPQFATPAVELLLLPELPPSREVAPTASSAPVLCAFRADIFQPPRA
ncbi:MAG: hypothetical protein ABW123_04540 [Cystobacter sp.]